MLDSRGSVWRHFSPARRFCGRLGQRDEGVPRRPGGPPHLNSCQSGYISHVHTQPARLHLVRHGCSGDLTPAASPRSRADFWVTSSVIGTAVTDRRARPDLLRMNGFDIGISGKASLLESENGREIVNLHRRDQLSVTRGLAHYPILARRALMLHQLQQRLLGPQNNRTGNSRQKPRPYPA